MFVTLLLVVIALLAPASVAGAATLPRLHAEPDTRAGGRIADARGREVLLRGVNVTSFGDDAERAPQTSQPPLLPFDAEQPDKIAAVGWNVVRLLVPWSRIEPRPGVSDEGVLAAVARQVTRLADAGLYTIVALDHRASEAEWAAFFADAPAPAPASGGVGIRTRYVAMLRRVAQRFARTSAVAGIDVMNEPGALDAAEEAALGPFYAAALRAIRAGERAGGGFRHLVLVEPSVLWSTRGGGAPPAFARDAGVVYAPHLSGGSIGTAAAPRRQAFATARAEAGGAPVLIGAWGADAGGAEPGSDAYVNAHQALQDRFRLSATLSPSPSPSLDRALLADLTRGWVRRAPGRLQRISWRAADGVLLAAGTRVGRDAGELEAFYPGLRPRVIVRGLTGVRMSRLGDGMLVRARPTTVRWTLQVYAR